MRYFETGFLEDADRFMATLDAPTARKVLYNIDLAGQTNDPRLFKKLQGEIWEFRTRFSGLQIRLSAFWDKSDDRHTLVMATHGFIKKTDKVPTREIERAERLRMRYFHEKGEK